MKKREDGASLSCSFCGKSQKEVRKLIAVPTVYICDECIELCNDIIAEEYGKEESPEEREDVPNPALFTDNRGLVLSRNDVENLVLEPIS